MPTLHRTQVLLEPHQHRALAEIARQEGRSLSDVLREMVDQQLDARRQQRAATLRRRLAVIEAIVEHRRAILDDLGGRPLDLDPAQLVSQLRAERDGDVFDAGRAAG
jgi:hypothetical protein